MTRGRWIFRVLLLALMLATCAFVSIGCVSAAEWHVYPGQSIQTAINSAGVDDVIYVHAGTYFENVNVSKRLKLIGVGKPVVDATKKGSAITLNANGITLDSFTAINANSLPSCFLIKAGIKVFSHNNTITNNTASNNDIGIYLYSSSNNILTGNTANSNCNLGVYLNFSGNNSLGWNTASNNSHGIHLVSSSNNNLTGNTVSSNYGIGIILQDLSNNNTLMSNTADSNKFRGIYIEYSSSNTLTGNTANSNNDAGICLEYSSNNILTGNTANSNTHYGILLGSSSNNTLTGNTALNNELGIYLPFSSNNTLAGNTANSNKNYGIRLSFSSNNTITNNTANSNSGYGIYLSSSSSNTIYNNQFNNTNNAWDDGTNIWNITKTAGRNIICGQNLGGNYWSDYIGQDNNGDGLGDTLLPYNSSGSIQNGGDWLPLVITQLPTAVIDSIEPNPAKQGKDTISFIGHGNDSDGSIVAYNWSSSIDGLLNTSASFTTPACELSVGTHTIYFTVQDDDGAWSSAATEILTILANQPPVASFSYLPVNPGVNETITFNALISYDQDGSIASYNWSFGDGNTANTIESMITHAFASVGEYTVNLTVTDNEGAMNRTSKTIRVFANITYFDTEPGTYPSISGTHNGTITMTHTVNVSKIFICPCTGTGGHIKYARIWNSSWDGAEARWDGYVDDWHNLSFDKNFTLGAGETYNYTIRTGSYPQIHHTPELLTAKGWITCTSFIDANGKQHEGWIPAIRLS